MRGELSLCETRNMSVVCAGNRQILEQLGEKRDFESELRREGFRYEEFTLRIYLENSCRTRVGWDQRYELKVTHAPTQTVKAYAGGSLKNWVTYFAADLAGGLCCDPNFTRLAKGR
jgi:hypothetical protein